MFIQFLGELTMSKIAFVGGGNMATGLIGGLIAKGWAAQAIDVVEPAEEQVARLRAKCAVRVHSEPGEFLRMAPVVVWAVKPQVMQQAIEASRKWLGNSLHISIAAGVEIATLATWLNSARIVRAMPNLPAMIGEGVAGLCAGPALSQADRRVALEVLESSGYAFWVDSEASMNAVTAVGGSGPGYVFHFLEGYQAAAEELGFEPQQARELVLQIVRGSVSLAAQDPASFRELRQRVSSKGGTTIAGTNELDAAATQKAMAAALRAARDRGAELARPQPF